MMEILSDYCGADEDLNTKALFERAPQPYTDKKICKWFATSKLINLINCERYIRKLEVYIEEEKIDKKIEELKQETTTHL